MTTTGNKLKMDTGEVSIVDKGANKKKRFPIFKAEEEMDFKEVLEAVFKTESDTDTPMADILKDLDISDKGKEALTAVVKTLAAFKGEIPDGAIEKAMGAAGFAKPKPNPEPEDEDGKKKAKGTEEPVKKELENLPAEVQELINKELEKRDAQVEAIKADNSTLQNALKVEKDARELAEWTQKAETELSHYPGKSTSELGQMFKRLHDSDPKLAEEQFENYKVSSKAMEAGGILKEIGSGHAGGANMSESAWDKIEKAADSIIEKSADTSREDAIYKAIKDDPDLYNKYLAENPAQTALGGRN